MAESRARFNLSAWALAHEPLMRYLMVVLLIGGAIAFTALGQDEDPPYTFRAMVVRTYWPGATAQQMAQQVADKIEKKLQETPYVDKLRSYSKPGESFVFVILKDSSPPREIPGIWYQVRKKIGDIRSTLPPGVIGPFFNDEFGDVYGVIFALSTDGFTYRELKDHAESVRQILLKVPDVAKVDLFGVQDEKVYVEVSHQKLAQLGLDVNQLAAQINAQNAVEGAGVVVLPTDNVQVRISGELRNLKDLEALPIRANGLSYRLGDIAKVTRGYVDPPRDKMRAGAAGQPGREVIGIGVSMAKGGDIVALGKRLAAAEERIEANLPVGISMSKVADQPRAVRTSVNEFLKVLAEALVIVLGVSFVALGLHTRPFRIDARPGLVVLLQIPLVLAITFLAMWILGINLHKISLGALIIALGLLVDDAIIAVEMMVRKMEEGYSRAAAVTYMYETSAYPMLTGTLITAAGFLPIALAKSGAGEYTFSIFAVTALALVISWFVAVLFVPLLGVWLLRVKPRAGADGAHELFDTPFYQRFRALVAWCLDWRKTVLALTLAALALAVFGFRYIEQQFFPDSSRLEVVVDLWLPEGSSLQATEAEAKRFEEWLAAQPEVDYFVTYVGTGAPRFYLPLDQQFNNTNLAQLVIAPRDLKARNALRLRIQALFREDFPNLRGRVKLLPNGPPVPYPVQFRVQGPDFAAVRAIADEVKRVVRANPNTVGVNDNWNENVKALKLTLDQDRARALGVSTQVIARAAQTVLTGTPIAQQREGDQLIDIVLRQPHEERAVLSRLADANVPTASGRAVPLSQLVKVDFAWEPGVIWRENRDYAITVQGEVRDGIQGQTVSSQIDPELAALRAKLPPDYRITLAGAAEESAKAGGAILANVPLMLFIVFTLLMLQLHSFSRSMMVFLTGPLGIIGAAMALLAFRAPFGFVAQLGVIALFGMIIRNSVILVDQIERDRAAGLAAWDAIIEACVRRFRPIMLTAAAAVLAMIPLSRSVFWGPMALAIMGGLMVATALTLLSLPALYATWFRVRRAAS
ncbi:MAG TPA: efflux RND transporter permease subunit [Burkholderiaceae bacterium]|nr:efflux RND transporter permease subunit [Burkholderiaceae bacterium]HPE01800.1 efflux RND transporter permease subunit [Burkholderiaceae bacterium]HRZ01632.1 efflux RND transporter permease subunit [Burkholderiaceae bacterium]